MTLDDFLSDVYRPLKLLGSPKTLDQYRQAVRALERSLGKRPTLRHLTDRNLSDLADGYIAAGRSPATANCHLRALRAMWNFAADRGKVKRRPEFRLLPEYQRVPRAWSVADLGRLLESCEQEIGDVGPVAAASFWRALVLTSYDTGARKTVLLNLTPADVDMDRRFIRLPAEEQKGRVEQVVWLSRQTVDAIGDIYHPRRDWLFPWPYDRYPKSTWTALGRHFRRIVRRAGLDNKHKLFHRLRKTRATYGERVRPGSAAKDLGHSDPKVTERHYIDPTLLEVSPVVDQLPRPEAPRPASPLRVVGSEVLLGDSAGASGQPPRRFNLVHPEG